MYRPFSSRELRYTIFYQNVVIPAQAEYSFLFIYLFILNYFMLKIFLHYSYIIAYDISNLKCIVVSIVVSACFFVLLASFAFLFGLFL